MLALQLLLTYLPGMNRLFGTAPISLAARAWIIGAGIGIHVVVEAEKAVRRWRARTPVPVQVC